MVRASGEIDIEKTADILAPIIYNLLKKKKAPVSTGAKEK